MSEKPILFSSAMIRAILDGRKTMTRRVVKPQPYIVNRCGYEAWQWDHGPGGAYTTWKASLDPLAFVGMACERRPCPHGRVGTHLWVRETWGQSVNKDGGAVVVYRADGAAYGVLCDADGEGDPVGLDSKRDEPAFDLKSIRWRPSIHMPRWASRLTLEIVDVRVERLQSITEEDARAEGVGWMANENDTAGWHCGQPVPPHSGYSYRNRFRGLWDSLNAERDNGRYAWAANPWVWVVGFMKQENKRDD
jgi:hypothetical protein